MLKVQQFIDNANKWDEVLVLSYEQRQKCRLRVQTKQGADIGLVLPRGTVLQDGQLLKAEDGRIIRIEAALEQLSRVEKLDATHLARVCYHLGNRHVPIQIDSTAVFYQQDHVIDQMLIQMGYKIKTICAAFSPESGAFKQH